MDPINYIHDVQSPFQAALAGYQGGAAIRNDQQQQQQLQLQQQQQLQLRQDLAAAANDHSLLPSIMVRHPEIADKLKIGLEAGNSQKAQGILSEAMPIYSALMSGPSGVNIAVDLLNKRADAQENSGDTQGAEATRTMAQQAAQDPSGAAYRLAARMSVIPGGDKIIENVGALNKDTREQQKLPGEVRAINADAATKEAAAAVAPVVQQAGASKAVSEATTAAAQADNAPALYSAQAGKAGSEAATAAVTAKYAEPTAKADLSLKGLQGQNIRSEISDRTKRFGLDSDKFQTETKIKLMELQNKLGELPEPVAKEVNSATVDSIAAQNSAAKMTDLADQLDRAGGGYGGLSSAAEWLKRATGNQNEMTRLRSEYSRIVTPAAMGAYKQVASGSTSDRDIETAMKGVPSDTADSATMASFLRGVAKLQTYDSVLKNAQAEWQGAVHSLGKTRSDIEIDGVKVPKGTTFKEFSDQYVPRKIGEMGKAPVTATNPTTGQKIKLVNGQWVPA